SADWDGGVVLRDAGTGKARHSLQGLDEVGVVAFSPDSKTVAAGDKWGKVGLWDVGSGRRRRLMTDGDWSLRGLAFRADNRTLRVGSWLNRIAARDPATGRQSFSRPDHHGKVTAVAFSPDGRTLVSSGIDGLLLWWDVATGQPVHHRRGKQEITGVAFSPDG